MQSLKYFLILTTTLLAGTHALLGHAQPSGDTRTQRSEVRPGCAIMLLPGTKLVATSGGNCVNGLLEGIAHIKYLNRLGGGTEISVSLHQQGRAVGHYLVMRQDDGGSWYFMTAERDENGFTKGGTGRCVGGSAGERANASVVCRAAAAIFGESAFDSASVLGMQMTAAVVPKPPYDPNALTRPTRDEIEACQAEVKAAHALYYPKQRAQSDETWRQWSAEKSTQYKLSLHKPERDRILAAEQDLSMFMNEHFAVSRANLIKQISEAKEHAGRLPADPSYKAELCVAQARLAGLNAKR